MSNEKNYEKVLYICLYSLVKNMKKDYFDDKEYNIENMVNNKLKGLQYVYTYFLSGVLQYHKKNEYKFEYLQNYYEIERKMLLNHSLQGKKLKILRASGKIEEVIIPNDCPIYYDKTHKSYGISIFITVDDNLNTGKEYCVKFKKFIHLEGKNGLLKLNNIPKITFYFNNFLPNWLLEKRKFYLKNLEKELMFNFNLEYINPKQKYFPPILLNKQKITVFQLLSNYLPYEIILKIWIFVLKL